MKKNIILGATGIAIMGTAVFLSSNSTIADETVTKGEGNTIKVTTTIPQKTVDEYFTVREIKKNISEIQSIISGYQLDINRATAELVIWEQRLSEANRLGIKEGLK